MVAVLDGALRAWVEERTGGAIASIRQIPAGSRTGYAVDVAAEGGALLELFLQRGARGGRGSFAGFALEAEVYGALRPLGIPVPAVWGFDEDLDVLLVARAPGRTWVKAPADLDEAETVASDFMQHLACWHALGAGALDIPSLGPVRTVQEHQAEQLEGLAALCAAADEERPIDILASTALEYLQANNADVEIPPVLVQGDTGPGNFMHADGRVTAIIDWELAHLGDPMDDIAWLSWRATQHGWPDFPRRLSEYEAASGIAIDEGRVRYYRLNACLRLGPRFGLPDMGDGTGLDGGLISHGDASTDRAADGSAMVMAMLHRRMRLTAQADAMGLDLPGREPTDVSVGEPPQHGYLYDVVVDRLRDVAQRTEDRSAHALAKAAAREVKFLRELNLHGGRFADQEREDLRRLLGSSTGSRDDDRRALAEAARSGTVPLEDYLLYQWRRLVRDDFLMRDASGSLYRREWPALA